jgi:hypothetical protein
MPYFMKDQVDKRHKMNRIWNSVETLFYEFTDGIISTGKDFLAGKGAVN